MKAHTWWYGEGVIATFALSALDMALWHIAAKERGLPLVELLGTPVHQALPVCASLHVNQATIAQSVEEIVGHIAAGFRSTKLGLGKRGLSRAGRDLNYDVALVATVRAGIGNRAEIMVDAGNGTYWELPTAIRTILAMEAHGIVWIEEPCRPEQVAAHVALRAATSTPVAVGEREWSEAGYRRWIDVGTADILGVDPASFGGVAGTCPAVRRRVDASWSGLEALSDDPVWCPAVQHAPSLSVSTWVRRDGKAAAASRRNAMMLFSSGHP